MVISLKYEKGKDYDENFIKLISDIKHKIYDNNDDFLLICVGDTGSGKSHLSLHAYELYSALYGGYAEEINNIAFKESDFADRLDYVSRQEMPRFLCYDEANVNKRNSMKTWNKDLIDAYLSIRGKNIFHWWNNPSIEMIDKAFVKEKLNSLIYVVTKTKNKPRLYLHFRREDLLELLPTDNSKLTLDVLKKNYYKAFHIGCFKSYKGKLLKNYLAKKEERMSDKITALKEKYGSKDKFVRGAHLERKLGVSFPTFKKIKDQLLKENKLIKDKHYTLSPFGDMLFKEEAIDLFTPFTKNNDR